MSLSSDYKKLKKYISEHKFLHMLLLNFKNYGILMIMLMAYVVVGSMFISHVPGQFVYSQAVFSSVVSVICWVYYSNLKKENKVVERSSKLTKKDIFRYIVEILVIAFGLLSGFTLIEVCIGDPTMAARAESIDDIRNAGSEAMPLYIIAMCTIIPAAEECMMRLFLYNLLKTGSHWFISMAVSSFVFAALHATISHAVFGTLFGMLMCLIYEFTGRWWSVIVAHMVYNTITICFSSLMLDVTRDFVFVPIILLSFAVIVLLLEIIFCFRNKHQSC